MSLSWTREKRVHAAERFYTALRLIDSGNVQP